MSLRVVRSEFSQARRESADLIRHSGLLVSEAELDSMEVAGFGLSRIREEGGQVVTLFATDLAGRITTAK